MPFRLMESRKIEKLKATLHILDAKESKPKNTHTLFVDDEEEKRKLDISERLDTDAELLERSHNRPLKSQLMSKKAFNIDQFDQETIEKSRYKAYKRLQQRINR